MAGNQGHQGKIRPRRSISLVKESNENVLEGKYKHDVRCRGGDEGPRY